MKLHDITNRYCINLEKRSDRKQKCELMFSNYDLPFTFFKAIDGTTVSYKTKISRGNVGCCLSHLTIWEDIVNKNAELSLIVEDDVVFHDDILNSFESFYSEVPHDWNLLYFGGNHCKLKLDFLTKHVHKLKNTYTTHCYAITLKCAKYLLNKYNNKSNLVLKEIDVNLADVQKEIPCYGFHPHLAWQDIGFSDILQQDVNYSFLKNHE